MRLIFTVVLVLVAALLLTAPAMAAEVPVSVQMDLYHKIWKLDRSLESRGDLSVAVLYQDTYAASAAAKDAVEAWAVVSHVHCIFVALDQKNIDAALQNIVADVFYVTPMRGADIERIARIARARQIHTMAGLTDYLLIGLSVGIGVRNDRPHIMINLDAAKAEGAAYQAQLLQMVEIVKAGHVR
jgi:hypothetical protein